jgi:hypothetical protein
MEANERIVLRFEARPVCSIKLHSFGLFEEADELSASENTL